MSDWEKKGGWEERAGESNKHRLSLSTRRPYPQRVGGWGGCGDGKGAAVVNRISDWEKQATERSEPANRMGIERLTRMRLVSWC